MSPRIALVLLALLALAGCRTRLPTARAPAAAPGVSTAAPAAAEAGPPLPGGLLEGIPPELIAPGPWKLRAIFRGAAIPHADFRRGPASVATWMSSVRVGLAKKMPLAGRFNADFAWENRKYEWSGTNTVVPNTDVPITMVNGFGGTLGYIQPLNPKWGVFANVTGRLEAEKGAPLSDGASWGVFGGIGRRFGRNQAEIGVGLGAIWRPGNQFIPLPIVQGFWQIDERIRLSLRGPALTLGAEVSENWQLSGVIAFDSARIRLTDSPPGNSGIFTDSRLTAQLHVLYAPIEDLTFDLFLGFDVWRELFYSNRDGVSLTSFRLRPAPVIGARIIVKF